MEDFPVATKESLAKLDVLKKEILASDFGEKKSAISELAAAKASPEVPEHKELEHHHVCKTEASTFFKCY
jgi:ribosome-binding protein aMBF1 (putative translation factor)